MKNIILKLLPLVLGLVLLSVGLFFLPIQRVSCRTNNGQTADQSLVCDQLQQLVGTRLLMRDFFRDQQVAELLFVPSTQESYDIQEISKSLSGEVSLVLAARPPLYRTLQAGEPVMITESGGVRQNNSQVKLPLVTDQRPATEQQLVAHDFLAGFLSSLPDSANLISEIIIIDDQRVEVSVNDFPTVLVELRQEPTQAARRLEIVLRQGDPESIDLALQELDLRFELPVFRIYDSEGQDPVESSDSAQVLIDS